MSDTAVGYICLTIIILTIAILFGGDPDIYDAIVHGINDEVGVCNKAEG